MSNIILHLKKEQQQIMYLGDALIENKPIPFPDKTGTLAYSNLFYWAHAQALDDGGIPLHYHEGFEIMTFILKGSAEHYDTATKVWTPLREGDVQVIQAGSGVEHSEKAHKGGEAFQIWFDPDISQSIKKPAAYKDYKASSFKSKVVNGIQELVYIGDDGIIVHDTPNISIKKLTFSHGSFDEQLDDLYTYSFYLLDGEISVDGKKVEKDDFFIVSSSDNIHYDVANKAVLFVIKSLTKIEYPLYIDKY
ncbi:pirin family protein [Sulfurospirillum arcachonense]|uniref:pirin family protein n=1 Tax=Sulfurospirillum arcachonense TaxID=57666 RepID=UPI0004682A5D|nr:pirin family protein [Sulfurospirillum arcachonense]